MPDFPTLVQQLSDIGAFGVSLLVIWALMTERLVPRSRLDALQKEFERVRRERDHERESRLRSTRIRSREAEQRRGALRATESHRGSKE